MAAGSVTLRLFPPYSTIVGRNEAVVPLERESPAPVFFSRLCDNYPRLAELFFPSGAKTDFPGYTLVLRNGVSLGPRDVVREGDVLEVLTALTGG